MNAPLIPQERAYTLSTKQGWNAYVNAPERTRPDLLTRAQLGTLSEPARRDYEEHRTVWHANLGPLRTPQMRAVHEDLDDIVEANRQDGDKVKVAAVIDALPGLGKSTIAQTFARDYHTRHVQLYGPVTEGGHERIPVVHVCLSSSTSKRSFNAMLCRFFNLPGADRGTAEHLGHKAADAVLACGVRLIVVDDVHFLDPHRRDGREVANHFKYLANTFPVTFIYVGVGIARRGLISEGLGPAEEELAQNGRRWTTIGVAPFEVETEPGRHTWRRLLLAIERDLVLTDNHPGMVADELSDYLFARSTGHFASLMTLVAVVVAAPSAPATKALPARCWTRSKTTPPPKPPDVSCWPPSNIAGCAAAPPAGPRNRIQHRSFRLPDDAPGPDPNPADASAGRGARQLSGDLCRTSARSAG